MKVEGTGQPIILETPEIGKRPKSEQVTHVLIHGGWSSIVPGSFKILKTESSNNVPSIPFVHFDQIFTDGETGEQSTVRVELTSPASLHAVAYPRDAE